MKVIVVLLPIQLISPLLLVVPSPLLLVPLSKNLLLDQVQFKLIIFASPVVQKEPSPFQPVQLCANHVQKIKEILN